MKRFISGRFFIILITLGLISLACNLPGAVSNSTTDPTNQPAIQEQADTPQPAATTRPTQALLRPTRQLDTSGQPKPTLPMPPAQTTREPQVVVLPQTNTQQQSGNTSGSGDLYISNASQVVICYFFLALNTETEWGPDQLGDQGVIQPGSTFTLSGVPYGTYDAEAYDCSGNLLAYAYGFDFPPNDTFTLTQ